MGHEVTHGCGDQGRRYDEHGNLKQWWSTDTLEHYQQHVRRIIDQYANFTAAFTEVQDVNTQGENIADNAGLRASSRRQVAPQCLPGLPHVSDDQLFFLEFAQMWCGNSTLGALRSKVKEKYISFLSVYNLL